MEEKILSISIAAYNVSEYIRHGIESLILDSTYMKKIDVIIVNDGSTDNTLSIAEEYRNRYPDTFHIIDKENGGYGSTINASLPVAKGKYYKLLDGDDWVDKEGICKLIDHLEKTDSDIVVTPYYIVRKEFSLEDNHKEIPKENESISSLSLGVNKVFHMHELAVRTDVLKGFHHKIAEHCFYTDVEYVFYCLTPSTTISRCDSPVYCYYLGNDGQSSSINGIRKHYRDICSVIERICECYTEHMKEYIGTKKEMMDSAVGFCFYGLFSNYMILENAGKRKKELIDIDTSLIRKYPEASIAGNNSRIVKITRLLRFHFFGLICKYVTQKTKKFYIGR